MGKKNKTSVGRTVLKHRNKTGISGKAKESWLHTSELNDGEELNTKSVTEQSALDEFLATAELAGTEFIAEKLNVTVLSADHSGGLPSKHEEQRIQKIQDQHKLFLKIPRRPQWDEQTTPDQLDQLEKENFLAWRRGLAELQKQEDLILTPFERNLEFWRQLWRVIERSNVVVQIVDARNPLLFRCGDLENYVKEVSIWKVNVLLVNKADYLTQEQRESWATYFRSIGIKAVFWSAVFETERLKQQKILEETNIGDDTKVLSDEPETILTDSHVTQFLTLQEKEDAFNAMNSGLSTDMYESGFHELEVSSNAEEAQIEHNQKKERNGLENQRTESENWENDLSNMTENLLSDDRADATESISTQEDLDVATGSTSEVLESTIHDDGRRDIDNSASYVAGKNVEFYTSGHLLTGDELLAYCQWLHHHHGNIENNEETQTVIGLVGYPNVGKSSTINAILQAKKVPVSSTPGRTKHFQTLLVDKNICLCDCPGLVFPSFVSTKAEMVICGILPIDQLRDHIPPVSLVCRRIPRNVLETVYGLKLKKPEEWEDSDRAPYAEELLNAYGYNRGYITSQARADGPRSARYILKDYVNGKLLYCHPPPSIESSDFQMAFTTNVKSVKKRPVTNSKSAHKTHGDKIDRDFFKQENVKFHTSATTGTEQYQKLLQASREDPNTVLVGKPWKKHGNRKKKEKLRRLKPSEY